MCKPLNFHGFDGNYPYTESQGFSPTDRAVTFWEQEPELFWL